MSINTGTQLKIVERLEKFLTVFVIIFECYFAEYHKRLVERTPKKGKTADAIDGVAEIVKGTMEFFGEPFKAVGIVLFEVIRKTAAVVGNKYNRDELEKLSSKLKDFKKNPDDLKKILIEAGAEVFLSFESKFARITASDNSWETAIEKVAEDGVNRIINYLKKNPEKDFSVRTIVDGVLFGKSKRYRSLCFDLPNIMHKGHIVKVGDFKITTSEFFKNIVLSSETNRLWPLPPDWNPCEFGLHSDWVDEISNTQNIQMSKASPEKYTYILTPDVSKRVQNDVLLKVITERETEHLKNILLAMKTEAGTANDNIMVLLEKNGDAVRQISQQFCSILKCLDKIDETTTDTNIVVKGNQDMLLDLGKKVDDIHKGMKKVVDTIDIVDTVDTILFDIANPSKWFTGRKNQLKDLDEKLRRLSDEKSVLTPITCISGLGGIGKSDLARQYIQDCREKSDYISSTFSDFIWINAENEESLTYSFLRLAIEIFPNDIQVRNAMERYIGNAKGKSIDINVIIDKVYKDLGGRNKCLVILDNVENQGYLYPFLPFKVTKGSLPYFIFTSRERNWGDGIEILTLKEMDKADAIQFVEKGLRTENGCERKNVESLVETLQYFPLAVLQAISYILVQREDMDAAYTVSNYLEEFNDRTQELLRSEAFKSWNMNNKYPNAECLKEEEEKEEKYSNTTLTIWDLTVKKIRKDENHGELAFLILNMMSYLSPDDVHWDMFFKLPEVSEYEVRDAVQLLVKYSMVKSDPHDRILKIHRLVQEVTRIKLDVTKESKVVMGAVKQLFMSSVPDDDKSESYVTKRKLLPHLEAFYIHLRKLTVKRPVVEDEIEQTFFRDLLPITAKFFLDLGKSRRAKQIYADILVIANKQNDQIFRAQISVDLCSVMGDLGEYEERLKTIDEALPILKKYYEKEKEDKKEDCSRYAEALEVKADALARLGKYKEAIDVYNTVLKIHDETSGNELTIATTKINLSGIYGLITMNGDVQKQEMLLNEALPIYLKHYTSGHINLAYAESHLASVYRIKGKPDEEIELLESCWPVFERNYGEGQAVARIWVLLSAAYGKKGDKAKTNEYSEKALYALRHHYGDEDHIEVARSKSYLAGAIGQLGDTRKQLDLLTSARPAYEKFYGRESWETVQLLDEIENCSQKLQQPAESAATAGSSTGT